MNGDVIYGSCEFHALCDQQDISNIWKAIQKKPYAVKSFILPVKGGYVFDLDRHRIDNFWDTITTVRNNP
jgi:hypothetical protein